MLTRRSIPVIPKRIFNEKCKIDSCSRTKRIGTYGLSNFCRIHEAYTFLVKLKYSMKKLFGTLTAGFTVLQREAGDYFTPKDLCNFMNFLMIPFLQDDIQNVFEVLNKKHRNKNVSIIRIEDMKKTMKSKEYQEIVQVEIRIILEVISSAAKQSSIKNILMKLDDDRNGYIDADDLIRVFRIRRTQALLFFKKVFNQDCCTLAQLVELLPDNGEMALNLSEIHADSPNFNFFSPRAVPSITTTEPNNAKFFKGSNKNSIYKLTLPPPTNNSGMYKSGSWNDIKTKINKLY